MGSDAYAHAFTGSRDRAGAFCRAISALAGDDEIRLRVSRWVLRTTKSRTIMGLEDEDESTVSLDDLPERVAELYTTTTRLTARVWTRLPSGHSVGLGIQLTHDEYTAISREKDVAPLVIHADDHFSRAPGPTPAVRPVAAGRDGGPDRAGDPRRCRMARSYPVASASGCARHAHHLRLGARQLGPGV